MLQAEVAALEEQVSALQEQLGQSQLDYVNEKAQIATLAHLMGGGHLSAERPAESPAAAALERRESDPASQPQPPDPWQTSAAVCSEVRAGSLHGGALSEHHWQKLRNLHIGGSAPYEHCAVCWSSRMRLPIAYHRCWPALSLCRGSSAGIRTLRPG